MTAEPIAWNVPNYGVSIGVGHPLQGLGVVVVVNTSYRPYLGDPDAGIEAMEID
jgi:hypothetical protein